MATRPATGRSETPRIIVAYNGSPAGNDTLRLGAKVLGRWVGAELVVACVYPPDSLGGVTFEPRASPHSRRRSSDLRTTRRRSGACRGPRRLAGGPERRLFRSRMQVTIARAPPAGSVSCSRPAGHRLEPSRSGQAAPATEHGPPRPARSALFSGGCSQGLPPRATRRPRPSTARTTTARTRRRRRGPSGTVSSTAAGCVRADR